MNTFSPRAVLFDLDETLYDFVTTSATALTRVSAQIEADLGVPAEEVRQAYLRILHEQMAINPTAGCHSRTIRFQLFFEERGLPLRLAPHYCDFYWNALLDCIRPFDGVPEALAFLRARNLRLGVGTNMTADWQLRKLERLGLDSFFHFFLSSEEAGSEKPSTDFFLTCARKAGVDPSECLFIGDNPIADIQGALKAGMQALWFQPSDEKAKRHPELPRFASFRELPTFFA